MTKAQQKVIEYIRLHPQDTYKSIAERIGVHPATVWLWAKRAGLPARKNKTPDISKLEG